MDSHCNRCNPANLADITDRRGGIMKPSRKRIGLLFLTGVVISLIGFVGTRWYLVAFNSIIAGWIVVNAGKAMYHTGAADAYRDVGRLEEQRIQSMISTITGDYHSRH